MIIINITCLLSANQVLRIIKAIKEINSEKKKIKMFVPECCLKASGKIKRHQIGLVLYLKKKR